MFHTYDPTVNYEIFLEMENSKYAEITGQKIDELINLGEQTENFPNMNRKEYIVFFHAAHFDVVKAHAMIVQHYALRTEMPEIFNRDNTDPELSELDQAKRVMSHSILFSDSYQTTRGHVGYRYVYFRFIDKDPAHFVFIHQVRYFFYMIKCMLIEYGTFDGLVVIVNGEGFKLWHFLKFNLRLLLPLKKLIQDAPPTRIKNIYILNTNRFMKWAYNIAKPYLSPDLVQKIVLCLQDSNAVYNGVDGVPRTIMPINGYKNGLGPNYEVQASTTYALMERFHNRYGPNTDDRAHEIRVM
ncbi:retinaldehyde-binding protein 1-like isoform X2 [Adelges cooleyi]|uniref:retinaldehyde-binding protein 1-like isoform X2 n=1 Tax=Adelges cooleyi TaxID=133065 RepID=UPI00217FCA35|nr:retinaldehyde-binding protein 1-like isoform X2 [Adelges cooleyi]